jgi:hypothetical protein
VAQITTQRDARALLKLPFCYACGRPFSPGDKKTDDHVPPKACFAAHDRNFPIKLPAHEACNLGRHLTDETFGQMMALKHGDLPAEERYRLQFSFFRNEDSNATYGALTNVDIHDEIRRWLRGFHAALYQEPLSLRTNYAIETPFPKAIRSPSGMRFEELKQQHLKFVETIKLNRAAGSIDVIRSNNDKLRYECVWDQADNGMWVCVFALDLYSWKDLGDVNNFQARGCAGLYAPPSGKAPALATVGTKIVAPIQNREPLDPFGA